MSAFFGAQRGAREAQATATDDELLPSGSRAAPRRLLLQAGAAVGVALVVLAGCALALAQQSRAAPGDDLPDSVSARQLLESRALADTLSESFTMVAVRNGRTPTPDERVALKDHVHRSLKQASDKIHEAYPEETARMNRLLLSRPEQGAILRAMSYSADPRVEQAGRGMVQSALSVARNSDAPASARHASLAEQLRSRGQEVRELRDEISPAAAKELRMEHVRLFNIADKWAVQAGAAPEGAPRQLLGLDDIHTGMMQQAQSFMDFMRIFHGVDMPDVSGLDESNFKEMVQCVSSQLSALSLTSVATCMSSYFGSFVDMMKSTFGFNDEASQSTDASSASSPWR